MAFLSSMNIVASGMTAQQLRLDVVGENVTNSTTTRVENGEGAYRRKMVVFEAETGRDGFRRAMARASAGMVPAGPCGQLHRQPPRRLPAQGPIDRHQPLGREVRGHKDRRHTPPP